MITSRKISDSKPEGQRVERVTTEGVTLLIPIETLQCEDGMYDIADPWRVTDDRNMTVIPGRRVSETAFADAVLVALTPTQR